MAVGKSSFILYCDQKNVWDTLTEVQAGKLIKYLFAYVNDENPTCDDPIVNIASLPIISSLKRDLKKWEVKQEQRKEAGRRSAELRKRAKESEQRKSTTVDERKQTSTVSGTVNGSVSGTVNGSKEDDTILNIISYLNIKTSKSFKPTTTKTKALISARLKEGFTIDDFKKVIDIKTKQWLNDSSFEQYLRPETLFGNKFEGYLNEGISSKQIESQKKIEEKRNKPGVIRVKYKADLQTYYHTEFEILEHCKINNTQVSQRLN